MNTDIRLYNGLCDHPKTRRLVRALGEESFRCLLRLWMWAADNRHKGVLTGLEPEDLSHVAGWAGDPETWLAVMIDTGWLDAPSNAGSNAYSIHGWEEHQGYVFNRDKRVATAKKGAQARWAKRDNAGSNAGSNAPSPTPTPTPKGGVAAAWPEWAAAADTDEGDRMREVERDRPELFRRSLFYSKSREAFWEAVGQ